jgi:hypothetical protein
MPHDDLTPGEQAYQGPVVLIVDANCYSASEMFAAGMQDNRLACVIGTHKQTGGGGAVLWSDERIAKDCADRDLRGRLGPLPGGASFDIAVLRTTRAGDRAGVAVEDMGVIAEQVHELTRRDVLGGNEDLLAVAAEKLAAPNDRPLVHAAYRRGAFRLRTRNVERVEIYLDDALVQTISELTQDHKLPAPVSPPRGRVVFRGVAQGEVVTTYRAGRPATAPRPPGIQPGPYE